MRLLHTSDWHLGRSFHREDLLSAQAGFVDFLVQTVRERGVDAVLVSGDVYDRALPGVDAMRLFDDALRRLAATGAHTVMISGNHDSALRLGVGADLMARAGMHIRTDPARVDEPVLLDDPFGSVAIYALPYLEPEAVRSQFACTEVSHSAVLATAMARVQADLTRRRRRSPATRAVVLAHAFVAGGAACESERDIRVGGASAVPTATFAGVDYAALGHLHGAQALTERVRYSGSPLAYSFSEEHHRKSVELLELGPDGVCVVERLPCPVPRPLARLRGRLDELVHDPVMARYEGHYLQVTLLDRERPREPMNRLRARFPHTLVLAFEPEGSAGGGASSYRDRLRGRDDLEVSVDFVEHVRRSTATEAEIALLNTAFEAGRRAELAS